MDKKELRKEILACRNVLSPQERKEKSAQIANKVIALEEFQKSDKVLLYDAIRSEVETSEIYRVAQRLGKDVYYPKVLGAEMEFYLADETTDFETGAFKIREPKPESTVAFVPKLEDKIFVLFPGAVFDEEGNRIGYGGGYYDKYLQRLMEEASSANVCKVAVAYECQMVETGRIQNESHDIQVDCVVTECRIIR